jgi:hypothetical protein
MLTFHKSGNRCGSAEMVIDSEFFHDKGYLALGIPQAFSIKSLFRVG